MQTEQTIPVIDELLELISQYDVVSLDIFDTLITRCVPVPADIFEIVETIINKTDGIKIPFVEIRKQAEKVVNAANGIATYDEIYSEIKKLVSLSDEKIEEIKKIEYKTELELLVARKDMLYFFNNLIKKNKKVVFVSDMYYTSSQLSEILSNCGYCVNGLEFIVSCEWRKAKQDGSLWEALTKRKGSLKWLHVGDNLIGDMRYPKLYGFDVPGVKFRVYSPLEQFLAHSLSKQLIKYLDGDISEKLVLGRIIAFSVFNNVYFSASNGAIGAWLGPILGSFMDFLLKESQKIDNPFLLFVTREGYIFKPLFEKYCETLQVNTPSNCLFFASRVSTSLAGLKSLEDIEVLAETPFSGTVLEFIEKKLGLNFAESEDKRRYSLPSEKTLFLKSIKPYLDRIFTEAKAQRSLYVDYCNHNFFDEYPILVDIGFTGRTQYNLSRILSRKVGGVYIMVENRNLPSCIGCFTESLLRLPNLIYENLPYFESSLQVREQSVLRLQMKNGKIFPLLTNDALISPVVQENFGCVLDFVTFQANWKRVLGDRVEMSEQFIQDVWMSILTSDVLPQHYLNALTLKDEFSGLGLIKVAKQKIKSKKTFLLFYKTKIKNIIKEHIPLCTYNFAREIWIRYFK